MLDPFSKHFIVLSKKVLIRGLVSISLHCLDGFDHFHTITHTSREAGTNQEWPNSSLNGYYLGQKRLILKLSELCKSVFIEDFQDTIDVLEIAIIRIDVNWKPSKILFVLDLGRFLLPPTFNLAYGPQLLILFFDSIEYSHEDVSYCFLSGYLSLILLVFFSVKLFNFGSLLHLT